MRVVYYVSLFPCWSETFIAREIASLLGQGLDVRIVSLKPPSEALVQSDARRLLDRVVYPPRGVRGLLRGLGPLLGHPLRSLGELARMARGLWRHPLALLKSVVAWWRTLATLRDVCALRPDHLHAHWATYPSTAAMFASERLGLGFSFTSHAHDIYVEDHLIGPKLARAAFGVTISEYNRDALAARYGAAAVERLRVIHCGVPTAEYAFAPEGREPGLVLAVGRLDPIKGFAHLVEACAELARGGLRFRCLIVGEGPLRPSLQARIAELGLDGVVELPGAQPQERIRELLHKASVFVLPSVITPSGDRDGIPVALMEAMACGLPVVSTRVSGIPELVEHERGGLLAPPGDAVALARCIERQLDTQGTDKQARVLHARRQVEQGFDIAQEAARLYAAFSAVQGAGAAELRVRHA
jgi:glycosyltransferase involved in cell wall biosynthesis